MKSGEYCGAHLVLNHVLRRAVWATEGRTHWPVSDTAGVTSTSCHCVPKGKTLRIIVTTCICLVVPDVLWSPSEYVKLQWTSSIHHWGARQTYLSLLEGLSGQVSSAGSLEQSNISPGLDIPLLLQPGQGARPEEHLPQRRDWCKPSQPLLCS